MLRATDFIIGDDTPHHAEPTGGNAKGLIPRDYQAAPVGFYAAAPPLQIPLIPRDQWVERIKVLADAKAFLSQLRLVSGPNGGHIPSLDQGSQGFCWAYSLGSAMTLSRMVMNQPYVRLSPHMLACIIKNYKDEGGWCGLSLQKAEEIGMATVNTWPEKSMSRSNDTPEMRAEALKYKPTEAWADMAASVYDRNLTEDQAMTLLLSLVPIQADFSWWSHSVCAMDAVLLTESKEMQATDFGSLDLSKDEDYKVFASTFGKRILNSWTDDWGDKGTSVLTGTKARLDGGVAPLIMSAA